MEYLTGFGSNDEAADRSQQEAWLRGCQNQPEDITGFWQGWIGHPVRVEFALVFLNEESKALLSPAELSALQSKAQMEADDWFVESEE